MIKRIVKMLAALCAGIGITLITQFLLPPAFLHYYGVSKYGEWLVLSATINYLSTLNFGITTYASNELTMLRKRNEMGKYRELQGSTLVMLLCMIGIGLFITSMIFFIPLSTLLHFSTITPSDAVLAAFFLGLQAMTHILAGYYNTLFMVVEETHRGQVWFNSRRLGATLISVPLAMFRVSFATIALGQFVAVLFVTLLSIYDLKRYMRELPLGIQGANWKTAKATIAPSGMFAMVFTQQFLIFQAPVIMLQWLLGPTVVVLFSISRTILSTARQVLQAITNAIAPEITFSYATRNMKKLLDVFHYSEKVVFAAIPVANLGAFLCSPILLRLWLQKTYLFDPYIYGLMALISGAMSMREHKQFFQFSTNTHKRLSMIVFFGNILMISISIPFTAAFGLYGFMGVWLVSEVSQMGFLYHENRKLFEFDKSINILPVLKLALVMFIFLPICILLVNYGRHHSLLLLGAVDVLGIMMLVTTVYFVFGLKDLVSLLERQVKKRAAISAA